jgi:uncharacterized protein (TIGR02687 family)
METTLSLFQEMNLDPIRAAFRKRLAEGERAFYWHDADGTFAQAVLDLDLPELDVYRINDGSQLELKLRLSGLLQNAFLLYRSGAEPDVDEDMFLDVKCYARPFKADSASMRLTELGLGDRLDLTKWVEARKRFLGSGVRVERFRTMIDRRDQESDLDRKALSVLAKAPNSEPREILMTLLDAVGSVGLNGQPSYWDEVVKFGLSETAWDLAEERFGYRQETGAFRTLLLGLFATDLLQCLPKDRGPASLQHLKLAKSREVSVFLSQWRDSMQRSKSYNQLATAATIELSIVQLISELSPEELVNCETFETVDKRIISAIRDELLEPTTIVRRSELAEHARHRLAGHWTHHETPGGDMLAACYEAIGEAVELINGTEVFATEINAAPSSSLPFAYLDRWQKIDRAYRKFNYWAQRAEDSGLDVLKPLAVRIENLYCNTYLQPLGLRWSEMLEDGALEKWSLAGIPSQRQFFADNVKKPLDDGDLKRVFVIISDALRFEAGVELTEKLLQFRLLPEIKPMLSVLPSITKLGMAALLPHQNLDWTAATVISADGSSTSGLENRAAVLAKVDGIAITAEELKGLKRDEGRALVKEAKVVYIYHNVIDATGDHSATEGKTFAAVETALQDLAQLVRRVIDHLNGSTVVITADHGFLYSESSPTEVERSTLGNKPDQAIDAKQRYLAGRDIGSDPRFHCASLEKTAGIAGVAAWYPKATQRFHLAGGAKYVHGGPLPQEVLIPVITVREAEGDSRTKSRSVTIVLATAPNKVTTNRQSWKFLQTEKVGDRLKPQKVNVGIYDGQRPVTNIESLVFDSAADTIADRERFVRLSLASEVFDSTKTYHLIARNAEDGLEVLRHPLKLEIAFTNEF